MTSPGTISIPFGSETPEVTLYHLQSSQSLRVLWALIYCEVPHKVVLVPRRADRTYPELLEHNPLGKAPVLKVGEKIFTESRLCIEQVRKMAKNALEKKDEIEAERDDYFSEFSTATLAANVRLCLMFELVAVYAPLLTRPLMRGITSLVVGKLKEELTGPLNILNTALEPSMPFFGGRRLGVSDFMMSWPLDLAIQRGYIDVTKWPNLKIWFESIQGMQSHKEALSQTKVYDLTDL